MSDFRKIIRESLLAIKRAKLDYAFLFFQFVVFVGAVRQFLPDNFLIVNLSLIILISVYKRRFVISSDLFILTLSYIGIIIIPLFTFDSTPRIYIGFFIRLLSAYFLIKYFRLKFFEYFENLVFILALISIPLFIIQLIDPQIFNRFYFLSRTLLTDVHLNVKPEPHKYIIIFLVNGWALGRNSGFAWEPAAFGAMLSWALLFNLFLNRFEINKRAIILFLVALTTFSIGTYIYLFLIMLLYLFQRKFRFALYFLFVSLVAFIALQKVPLVRDNFIMMKEKTEMQPATVASALSSSPYSSTSITRVAGFYVNIKYFLKWPWAYGFADNSDDRRLLGLSSNGLMVMIARWGIAGVLIIILGSSKLLKILNKFYYDKLNWKGFTIGMLVFILPFSGNPFYNRPLSLALLLFGFFSLPRRSLKPFSFDNEL